MLVTELKEVTGASMLDRFPDESWLSSTVLDHSKEGELHAT